MPAGKNLDVRAAYIHNQYLHRCSRRLTGLRERGALQSRFTPISSFHDFTNDFAPSSWSRAANASISMPALANSRQHLFAVAAVRRHDRAHFAVIGEAFKVASGIVFTVKGAASALTYRISDALGSLVPVLAQSRRCGRAPAVVDALPARGAEQLPVGLIDPLGDRDAEPVAQRLPAPCPPRPRPSG